MGSSVYTRSEATDNRQAVTDEAFGLSSSGIGNNTALNGHIFNIGSTTAGGNAVGARTYATSNSSASASGAGGGTSTAGSSGVGGALNINLLDNGAIDKSFDFAAFSLSEMLASIIEGGKQQQQTAQYTVDSIGNAIKQSSAITAAGAAASAAVEEEINGKNVELVKKGLIIGGLAFGAWFLFMRGKK